MNQLCLSGRCKAVCLLVRTVPDHKLSREQGQSFLFLSTIMSTRKLYVMWEGEVASQPASALSQWCVSVSDVLTVPIAIYAFEDLYVIELANRRVLIYLGLSVGCEQDITQVQRMCRCLAVHCQGTAPLVVETLSRQN